jgi:hypothetical protein
MMAGPFAAVAGLLVAAGIAKLGGSSGTRLLGAIEAAAGGYALLAGSRVGATAVAGAYVAFAVVVLARWWREGPTASCECFGARSSRATPVHALVDAGAALVAVLAVVDPPGSLAGVLGDQPVAGLPFVVASATVAYLAFVMMTAEVVET